MGRNYIVLAALLCCCPAAYCEGPAGTGLAVPAAAAGPGRSTNTAAGVIPAELESGSRFCEKIEELLRPPEAAAGKLKPLSPAGLSGPEKEREKAALKKEAAALKLCSAAGAQRKKIAALLAAAAQAPENSAARTAQAENLGRQAALLERTALALFLEARALRAKNAPAPTSAFSPPGTALPN